MYADDANIFERDMESAAKIASDEYMSKLSTWFIANKLSLNTDKTCFMVFSTQQYDEPSSTNNKDRECNGS